MPRTGGGLQLGACWLETGLDRETFEAQYSNWETQLFWNEQRFQDVQAELLAMGAKDGCFCLKSRYEKNRLTIVLYYTADVPLSAAQKNQLLQQLEDDCIRVGDHEISFRIQRE